VAAGDSVAGAELAADEGLEAEDGLEPEEGLAPPGAGAAEEHPTRVDARTMATIIDVSRGRIAGRHLHLSTFVPAASLRVSPCARKVRFIYQSPCAAVRSDRRHNLDMTETVSQHRPRSATASGRRRLTRTEAQALTRRRLLDSAAEVFAEQGFRAASLADVAEHAGYTIGAVYSNFASKDELFQALMRGRLQMLEAGLEAAFQQDQSTIGTSAGSFEDRIERELDRMAASEDAVPAGWWRLLNEYRAYAASDPAAWAALAESERRCREIIAGYIDRFAVSVGSVPPIPSIEIAELTTALTDGLRAAHADGRSRMTSGEGLRLVVSALMAASTRVDVATARTRSSKRKRALRGTGPVSGLGE
jgi:AcrR family transcriptional regulator